jgi:uncharacterized membrane protein HdeD (DUF308 family)
MNSTLTKNWWLLALCGVLEAVIALIYFDIAEYGNHSLNIVANMGRLTLVAGVVAIAAGLRSTARARRWLLVLNGLAVGVLGVILGFWRGRLAFRSIADLVVVMALSLAVYELTTTPSLRRRGVDGWLPTAAGVVALVFAAVFLAFVFRWIRLDPAWPAQGSLWLGSYFCFSAFCMLGMARRWHRLGLPQSDLRPDSPPLGSPKHAH